MIRQLAIALAALSLPAAHAVEKVKVLIVTGQNNHNWVRSTPVIRGLLEETGRFDVTVTTTPTKEAPKDAWQDWRPAFGKFDVVVSDYNGKEWPEPIKAEFVGYVSGGTEITSRHQVGEYVVVGERRVLVGSGHTVDAKASLRVMMPE